MGWGGVIALSIAFIILIAVFFIATFYNLYTQPEREAMVDQAINDLGVLAYPVDRSSDPPNNSSNGFASESDGSVAGTSSESVPNATVAANENCSWVPYYSNNLKIGMQTMQCSGLTFIEEGATIGYIESNGNRTPAVGLFTKDEEKEITESIRERFVDVLPEPARSSCTVVKSNRLPARDSSVERYTIVPEGEYAAQPVDLDSNLPSTQACGQFGSTSALTFFEYQPQSSQTKYVFVLFGNQQPPFDAQTIVIN